MLRRDFSATLAFPIGSLESFATRYLPAGATHIVAATPIVTSWTAQELGLPFELAVPTAEVSLRFPEVALWTRENHAAVGAVLTYLPRTCWERTPASGGTGADGTTELLRFGNISSALAAVVDDALTPPSGEITIRRTELSELPVVMRLEGNSTLFTGKDNVVSAAISCAHKGSIAQNHHDTELSEAYIKIAEKRTCQQGLFSHAIAD